MFQVDDLNSIKDWWLSQGGSIDSYFYSETATTGSDGTLGNEYICLRDDVNQVYVGRSDVCVNRQMDSTYSYVQIDKMDWSEGFPDLTVLQTGDLIGDTYEYWQGCFNVTTGPQWAGYSGGQCPNISISYGGQINYGYIQQTLKNIAAINLALEEAGVEVTGYTYSWQVKNADANYETQNNPGRADPFSVTVKIRDDKGNEVFSKTYDYSYWIDNWTQFSGTETLSNPLEGANLSELELSVKGYDIGYWAGYYGPEFRQPSIKLNYRAASIPVEADTTVEDLLFNQMCQQDPLYDPTCPGYQDSMLAAINVNVTNDITANEPSLVTDTTTVNAEAANPTGIEPTVAESTSANTGTTTEATAIETETASSPSETVIAEESVTEEPVQEEQVAESSNETSSSGGVQLNSTQLAALNAANAVANNAVGTAIDSAGSSASIGLSETGGVSSALTSDGVTNEQGVTDEMSSLFGESVESSTDIKIAELSSQSSSSSTTDTIVVVGSAQESNTGLSSTSESTESDNQQVSMLETESGIPSIQQDTNFSMQQDIASGTGADQNYGVDQSDITSTEVITEVEIFNMQDIYNSSDAIVSDTDQQTVFETDIPEIEIPGLEVTQQDFSTEQQEFEQSYVDQQAVDSVQTEEYYTVTEEQQGNMSDDEQFIMENVVELQTETTDYGLEDLEIQATTVQEQNLSEQDQQNTGTELVMSDAVETADITGEEALAQANELAEQASLDNMLPTVNSVPVLSELDFVGRFVADFVASLPELPVAQEVDNKTEEEQRLEEFKDAVFLGQALNGDDSEDAKAALLGHNPNFGTYLTDQMKDAQFYKDKEIYTNKKNYDSPAAGLFNAGSDARHKALVDLQYKEEK